MSTIFHYEQHTCPKCLNEDSVVVWDVIHAQSDPDLTDRLLKKHLLSFECANCGEWLTVSHPVRYIDDDLGLQIYYEPRLKVWLNDESNEPFMRSCMNYLKEQVPIKSDGHMVYRLAADVNEVIESIHLAQAGLDDRVMAVLKAALISRYQMDEGIEMDQLYFLSQTDEQLLYQAHTVDQGWYTVEVDRVLYDQAVSVISEALPPDDEWLRADLSWGQATLARLGEEAEANEDAATDNGHSN